MVSCVDLGNIQQQLRSSAFWSHIAENTSSAWCIVDCPINFSCCCRRTFAITKMCTLTLLGALQIPCLRECVGLPKPSVYFKHLNQAAPLHVSLYQSAAIRPARRWKAIDVKVYGGITPYAPRNNVG